MDQQLSGVVLGRLVEPGIYSDGGGLRLYVSGSQARSWVFLYTVRGKRHEMGLGSIITIDLAAARAKARECRQLLFEGRDPLLERRASHPSNAHLESKRITHAHALAHKLPDKVEAAYRRGDLLVKRVLLMQARANYC